MDGLKQPFVITSSAIPRQVRNRVKVITMDMFSPYYRYLLKNYSRSAKIVLNRFHIVQHLSRAMNRLRVQIMNQFDRKSHEYRALKRYWKLIQQDSRKLSDKRFYRPTVSYTLDQQGDSRKATFLLARNFENIMNSINFSYSSTFQEKQAQTISLISLNRR
jgi:transposase